MSAEERKKKSDHVTSPAHVATARSAASQRRHELFNNTLVNQWQKLVDGFKGGPSRTTWIVGGVAVAVVLLYIVWHYFSKSSEEKSSARWLVAMKVFDGESATAPAADKMPPNTEAELDKIVKDEPGTSQARVARFYLARLTLAQGEKDLGSRRDAALEKVRKAAELYEKLQADSSDSPVLHQEAILRSGKAREMLGDFGKALDDYNLLMKEYPKSAFFDEAKAGAERLKDGSSTRKELEALNASLNRKGGP